MDQLKKRATIKLIPRLSSDQKSIRPTQKFFVPSEYGIHPKRNESGFDIE